MPPAYPVHEYTLGNGLRIVVSPDPTTPIVAVNLWVGVGSRHEEPGRTGFAHLFEHLMFQGSRNVASGEHFSALMAVGGRLNATTWFDRTNYFETVPTGALELALWLEADRHGYLLDAVNQENLDNQRDVVKEEKRQRYDNQPYGNALPDIYGTVFPAEHPYHHPTIGSMADLDAATVADVHAFFRRYYGPNNTVLSLVGDVAPDDGFALAERYFGDLPATAQVPRPPGAQLAPLAAPARLDRHTDVPNDRLYLAFRLPVDPTPQFLAGSVALDCLAGLTTSRLTERLIRAEQVAYHVDGHAMGLVDGSSLGLIAVDVADGQDADRLEAEVLEELDRFAAEGPSEPELEAVRALSERSWLQALASHDERADLLSHAALLYDDPGTVNTYLDRLGAIDAGQVQEAATTWLRPDNRAVVAYLRDADEAAA